MLSLKYKKVKSIKLSEKQVPVYDVDNVDGSHLFLLSSGMIVHNCLDEISAIARKSDYDLGKNKGGFIRAFNLYNAVYTRMKNRFMKKGGMLPGKLILICSKKSEQAFLEQYIESVKGKEEVFIVDDAIWSVKPKKLFSGEKFKVAVGNKYLESFILGDNDKEIDLIKKGYKIIEVPQEYYDDFDRDMNGALRDLAGISVSGVRVGRLFSNEKQIDSCIKEEDDDLFPIGGIEFGLDDYDLIENYIDIRRIKNREKERFLHIDIGLKKDRLGIACVHFTGNLINGKIEIDVDFVLFLKAKYNDEIPLNKVETFIKWLKDSRMNIEYCNFDGYESAYIRQNLNLYGIKSKRVSVDKNDIPYSVLKEIILDKRIKLPKHNILIKELKELEHNFVLKKVDHPKEGSKDISDALAGACYECAEYYADETKVNSQGLDIDLIEELNMGIDLGNDFENTGISWVIGG